MTTKARTPEEIAALYQEHIEGRIVRGLLVHGVNSLKSMDPTLDALVGGTVNSLDIATDTTFTIGVGDVLLDVDLQRVGSLRWVADISPWAFGQSAMPTGQLLLGESGGVNFVEPSKTKRITFRPRRS